MGWTGSAGRGGGAEPARAATGGGGGLVRTGTGRGPGGRTTPDEPRHGFAVRRSVVPRRCAPRRLRRTGALLAALCATAGLVTGTASAEVAGAVVGRVWFDRDGDGARDPEEPGRAGVVVHALGVLAFRTTTDVNGEFRVPHLPVGEYRLTAESEGYEVIGAREVVVQVGAEPVDVGFAQRGGEISGYGWWDSSGSGAFDSGEGVVAATWKIAGFSDYEGWVSRQVSAPGQYAFRDLPAGVYRVEVDGPGWPTKYRADKDMRNSDVLGVPPSTVPIRVAEGQRYPYVSAGFTGTRRDVELTRGIRTCLDQEHPGGSPTNRVGAWECHGGANQRWALHWLGLDRVAVVNAATGDCLDQETPAGAPTNVVGAWGCNGGSNQKWVIGSSAYDRPELLVNAASGMCLDHEHPTGTPTNRVGAWWCSGAVNQEWDIR